MIADFMTKPLQGETFIQFWNLVFGIKKANNFDEYRKEFYEILKQYGLQERVVRDLHIFCEVIHLLLAFIEDVPFTPFEDRYMYFE